MRYWTCCIRHLFSPRIEMAASSFCSSGGKAVCFITFDSLCPVRLPSVTSKFQSSCHFGFLVADRDKLEYILKKLVKRPIEDIYIQEAIRESKTWRKMQLDSWRWWVSFTRCVHDQSWSSSVNDHEKKRQLFNYINSLYSTPGQLSKCI